MHVIWAGDSHGPVINNVRPSCTLREGNAMQEIHEKHSLVCKPYTAIYSPLLRFDCFAVGGIGACYTTIRTKISLQKFSWLSCSPKVKKRA